MAHHPHRRQLPPEIEEKAPHIGRQDGTAPANRCPNCRYVDLMAGGLHCRKNPPEVDIHRPGLSYWPRVSETDWCGAFEQ